jgi:hypothetical protein
VPPLADALRASAKKKPGEALSPPVCRWPEIYEGFTLNKRAFMLTAAVTALLSGQAFGQTNPNPPCAVSTSTITYSTTSPQLCAIATAIATPLYTGMATSGITGAVGNLGNFTIETDGTLTIGTNPPTGPAITINSGTASAPVTVTNTGTITYAGISYTVGALLEEASPPTSASTYGTAENWVGEYESLGTMNLTGAGTNKTGILIAGAAYSGTDGTTTNATTGTYANLADVGTSTTPTNLGVFTGIVPSAGGDPVAINLAIGSTLEVQGTSSYGINLIGPTYVTTLTTSTPTGGATLIGDIDIGGSIEMTPTTVNTTTTGNVAINIAGWLQTPGVAGGNPALAGTPYASSPEGIADGTAFAMIGNVDIEAGGSVSSEGEGAQGVVILGPVNGAFINSGSLSTVGTSAGPSTAVNADDPEAGSALFVANNLTGGIYNDGPSGTTGASPAIISMIGNAYTIEITPEFTTSGTNPNVETPITIGKYAGDAVYGSTDTLNGGAQFSLLNRGQITASGEDANISTTDLYISGTSSNGVTLLGGIFNSGTMGASVNTNVDSSPGVTATTISIGTYVNIGTGTNVTTGTGTTTGGTAELINSNETGSGSISAFVTGDGPGTAVAITIAANQNPGGGLQSIYNSGTISATAESTLTTTSSLSAYAIEDFSGTLTTIVNQGTISATATTLDDNDQVAIAIDAVKNNSTSVTVTDQSSATSAANIVGDVYFGGLPGTLTVTGDGPGEPASVNGNIYFYNTCTSATCPTLANPNDQLTINQYGSVTGEIIEAGNVGSVDIAINPNGALDLLTSLPTNLNSTVSTVITAGVPLSVGNLNVVSGGVLKESLSQGFNVNVYPGVSVINAQTAIIGDPINTQTLQLGFGSFVAGASNGGPSSFVLVATPSGTTEVSGQEVPNLDISVIELQKLVTSTEVNGANAIPFLFTGNICTYNVATATGSEVCPGAEPTDAKGDSEIVLNLTPKSPVKSVANGGLGLTGYALQMFPYVNQALVNDNSLGAAMITDISNQSLAQAAYASFAPDVSGATRATAISLTDSATNIVAARQRELNMYLGQEGGTTLWGQQFGERLSEGDTPGGLTGYNDSGFGFVFGMDDGDPVDGRYGGAFTFFAGGMSQKEPTSAKTASEYYMFTGYSNWRGKGLFIDTQATIGYGNLKGKRYLVLTDNDTGATISREADDQRPTELLAGGVTTGSIFNLGGTVLTPQLSVDGLTMREEGYTEANGGEGFDLHVDPYYADSLRAFLGGDVRQDVNFGGIYLQPELRAGYRYDFVNGSVKLKANFLSVSSLNNEPLDPFSIQGPDPGHGNIVLGGGLATTTGAWSVGVNYDYVRGGDGPTEQTGLITLIGRI